MECKKNAPVEAVDEAMLRAGTDAAMEWHRGLPQELRATDRVREQWAWLVEKILTAARTHPRSNSPEIPDSSDVAHPCPTGAGMVSVVAEDANNYCRILTALGMEEEGDPVAEVEKLIAASYDQGAADAGVTSTTVPTVEQAGEVDNRALVEAIAKHQFSDDSRRGRLTIDVETLLAEYNARAQPRPVGVPDGPLTGKYADVLVPFVSLMERELHANAGKGDRPGWLSMTRKVAVLEIHHHVAKLQKAVLNFDVAGVREYAADVANMSMMAVDVCGALIDAAPAPGKGGEG